MELIEDEHHDAHEKDERLHGDLKQTIEEQAHSTLPNRSRAKVALDLRLIRAEIRHGQEEAAK